MAGAAGVVFVLLAVLYFVYLPHHKPAPIGGLSAQEQQAVNAAGTEAVNLSSYRRAHFEQDFARALAGTTGALSSDVKADKAMTLKVLTENKYDISATVRHAALVGPAVAGKTTSYVVLVVLFGYTSANLTVPNPQNLEITVNKVKGKWLASNVTGVTIS